MKNNILSKKNLIILIIFIVLLSVFVFSITYSFFAARIDNENVANVSATTGSGSYVFTVFVEDSIEYNVSGDLMSSDKISTTPVGSDNASLKINLSSPDSETTTLCTYDIIWEWTSDDRYTSTTTLPVVKDSVTYPYEFSISANKIIAPGSDTSGYTYTDTNLLETDLSNFEWSEDGNQAVLISGTQIASRSKESTDVTWNFVSNLYNIPTLQNSLGGKHFQSRIYVDNVNCQLSEQTP